eukprot:12888645-Prorocentrum_lima.AAC.1
MQCFARVAGSVLCHAKSPSQHARPFIICEMRSSHCERCAKKDWPAVGPLALYKRACVSSVPHAYK